MVVPYWQPSAAEWEPDAFVKFASEANYTLVRLDESVYMIRECFLQAGIPVPYIAGPFETEEAATAALEVILS